MSKYLKFKTPATDQAEGPQEPLRAQEPRPRPPRPGLLEPARAGALRRGHLPPGGLHGPRRPVCGQHRQVVGPGRPGQVRRARGERPRTRSGGASTTGPTRPRTSRRCSPGCRPFSRTRSSSSRTATSAPIPSTGCRSGSSPSTPGTRSSPATCSSLPKTPGGVPEPRARVHGHRRALLQGRPADRRHPLRDRHHPQLRRAAWP